MRFLIKVMKNKSQTSSKEFVKVNHSVENVSIQLLVLEKAMSKFLFEILNDTVNRSEPIKSGSPIKNATSTHKTKWCFFVYNLRYVIKTNIKRCFFAL